MKRYNLMLLCFIVGMGLMATVVRAEQELSVKDFGAVGDGVTDDSAAIQDALESAFANGQNLYFPSATYAIGTTLIIPQYHNFTMREIRINCGNSAFKMLTDTTLFTSGYYNGNTLVSNFGTADDSHYSQGIVLENFNITSNVGTLTQPAMKIQDWHQGCAIQNISSDVTATVLQSYNNYYTLFDNIRTICASTAARFIFGGNINLNKFTRLVACNAGIGYKFDGGVTACQFTYNSVEGVGIGLQFNSCVYDIAIENNYIEGFSDVAIDFNDYVQSAKLNNNYVNFLNTGTSYFVDYIPLPLNNIIIDSDNVFIQMPGNANIIKTLDTIYSAGVIVRQYKVNAASLDDLIVSNLIISPNIDWQQKMDMPGLRANVVNNYAVGNYSGKFTNGHSTQHGFVWVNMSNSTLKLTTKILPSSTQRIYVNVYVYASGGSKYVKGEFIGTTFYEYTTTGVSVSTKLSVSTVNGFNQINGTFTGTVTGCVGEVRLI